MIILAVSDIHGMVESIEKISRQLQESDVACITGDITHFGGAREAGQVVESVCRYAPRVLAVHGNCDTPEVVDYLDEKGINLHARAQTIDGIGFLGLGGSLETPFHTPIEYAEADLRRFLDQAKTMLQPESTMVLVSHQPPANTACDRLNSGHHVGSHALHAFIEEYQPLVCFTGHIHEAVATDRIGKTRIVNPGQLGSGRYAYAEIENSRAEVEIRSI